METALVLLIPEAEAIVSRIRAVHDRSAALGMPAHITVLYPFRPYEEIDATCLAEIEAVMTGMEPLDIVFRQHARFPNVLWLAPEPSEKIVELTEAVATHFPECPPYSGIFDAIIPHLTVAEGDDDVLEAAAQELTQALRQPVKARASQCVLFVLEAGRWQEKHRFLIGGRKP